MFNLHFKQFKNISNTDNGEVNSQTIFEYFQDGDNIWANYHGGEIKSGFLEGKKSSENGFEIIYSHTNTKGKKRKGKCKTEVSFTKEGKTVLNEFWQWTNGDKSKGTSTLKEL